MSFVELINAVMDWTFKMFGKENVRNGWANDIIVIDDKKSGCKYKITIDQIK